jgi:hypothetical protein
MGGPGSGNHYHWWRHGKKTVVEDCRSLDANRWMREGILKAGIWHTGLWCWYQDAMLTETVASICYEVNMTDARPCIRLFYDLTATSERIDYQVPLAVTSPRFGGRRWWFVCPLIVEGRPCKRRVGKLYLPPQARYFGCRYCHQLTYTSCQESHKYDRLCRVLARNMGWDFDVVKQSMNRIGERRSR